MNENRQATPVFLLSGFLGSGKTTLLRRLLDYCKAAGLQPAVIMNELGDANLDGQLLGGEVPMAEMLSGCICCTIRGDLGLEIGRLIDEHRPDIVFIESTGAANPMETLDGVTDAAMYKAIELRGVITVVDGPELLERGRRGKGRTYKLMREQIRCATLLLLNKADKLEPEQLVEAQQQLRELNAHAPVTATVRCAIDDWSWLDGHAMPGRPTRNRPSGHDEAGGHSHAHDHVMVVTHYWRRPISSTAFEALLARLPDEIYRAKGIVTFSDTPSRFLFQYAYKESDFIRIEPQGQVNDVAVFIGEHFDKDELMRELERLEDTGEQA
ncbi:CobW family GTP-binding protein [Paenibacillus arenilitoris]|uniref:GTP-binding protein n=1 Tax=Paenibacillus arenilitoris TaxID=2772299 RepID=A0A927H7S1_9BACL|nr:GTP-binding protein [Paenibacillus arenilitoris]MBD2870948.1 GTP-binding protein [Paenibacillus arenilitoris]